MSVLELLSSLVITSMFTDGNGSVVWQEITGEILNIYYQDWHIVHDSFYTTFGLQIKI